MTAKKKPAPSEHEWAISLIRKRGQRLGTVEAPDKATALKLAIELLEIKDPDKRKRLAAQRAL